MNVNKHPFYPNETTLRIYESIMSIRATAPPRGIGAAPNPRTARCPKGFWGTVSGGAGGGGVEAGLNALLNYYEDKVSRVCMCPVAHWASFTILFSNC